MYMLLRKLVEIFFRIKYKMNILNRENIPDLKGGFIVACNHQTYADPPMIAAVLKGKFSFMAKSELFEKKAFAWLIRKCGAFPVVRGAKDNSAIEQAISDLKDGRIFVIFPEGTRSKDGTLGRAKSGVAVIAGLADAPVLPMCIMYGLGGKKRKADIAIGKLISAEEIAIDPNNMEDRRQIKKVSNLIMDNIAELQQQIYKQYE